MARVAALVLAALAVACGAPSGSGAAPTDCSSVKSPADTSAGLCATCLQHKCCPEGAACAGNADCLALSVCWNACADNACLLQCESSHPDGKAAFLALRGCSATNCLYTLQGAQYQCSFSF